MRCRADDFFMPRRLCFGSLKKICRVLEIYCLPRQGIHRMVVLENVTSARPPRNVHSAVLVESWFITPEEERRLLAMQPPLGEGGRLLPLTVCPD